MRLINCQTNLLEEFHNDIPPYAILSHTWTINQEVTFEQWQKPEEACQKKGYHKINLACKQALKDKLKYAWVDTCCINKTSSSELTEAINSMFVWYRDAAICYVFMDDVTVGLDASMSDARYLDIPAVKAAFKKSVWFTRGWTLQELLAPSKVLFYSSEWKYLATKADDGDAWLMAAITGIDHNYIKHPDRVYSASVARRMSWMGNRKTTRIEDIAYCLLGIFNIHMDLLYGEGHRAFLRLQEEIIRISNDQTIFCWQAKYSSEIRGELHKDIDLYGTVNTNPHREQELKSWTSILAPHPSVFRGSAKYVQISDLRGSQKKPFSTLEPYSITNLGLSISLPLMYTAMGAFAVIDVGYQRSSKDPVVRVLVPLHRLPNGHFIRMLTSLMETTVPASLVAKHQHFFVDCRNSKWPGSDNLLKQRVLSLPLDYDNVDKRPIILLTSNKPMDLEQLSGTSFGMELMPLHGAVEASIGVPGYRGAVILNGKILHGGKFHLLVGGQLAKNGKGSTSISSRLKTGMDWVSDVDWHIDVWDDPPFAPSSWTSASLKPLIDQLSTDFFGSWCASGALKNVMSWRYSPKGALICYFELSDSTGQSDNGPGSDEEAVDDETHFRHLQRSNFDLTSLQHLYWRLHGGPNNDQHITNIANFRANASGTFSMPALQRNREVVDH